MNSVSGALTGFEVLERSQILFPFNLRADIEIEGEDEQVRYDVENSHTHEHLRVLERYLFRHLHHPQDDSEVRTVLRQYATRVSLS